MASRSKAPPAAPARTAAPAAAGEFAAQIGELLRLNRAKRGMTRRQLANSSGASERYLAQIEGGQGNPSVIMLKAIAEALDVALIELLPRPGGRIAALSRSTISSPACRPPSCRPSPS